MLVVEKVWKVSCERVKMQEVDKFNYLGAMISTDGGMGEEVSHKVIERRKVVGTMAKLRKEEMISREIKQELWERVVIPTVVYGSEMWSFSAQERRKIEVCVSEAYAA